MALTSTNGVLRLTDANFSQSSLVLYTSPVSSSQGLKINFDFYAYGGTGADGISFFLLDGSQAPTKSGGTGGSLGYAPLVRGETNEAGIAGGYLGIGFDEFGSFSGADEGRIGGIGVTPDAIAVRGSAATNYAYLAGTQTLPISLDNPGAGATRANSRRQAQIDLTPNGLLSVRVDLNNDGDFLDAGELAIDSLNVVAVNGALPSSFKFGFAASTGGSTNIHEIGNFSVKTAANADIPGRFSDLLVVGSDGDDQLVGGDTTDDIITGGAGKDTVTGGGGADRFLFSGSTKAEALRTSTLRSLDQIKDFNFSEGDRFQLDFDNNLNTVELPRRLYNAGSQKGSLRKAVKSAYADKFTQRRGNQALKANEAVFFTSGSRTYLSINDNKAAFSAQRDLLVDVTGIQFASGDAQRLGTLGRDRYFV
jgi:Ca2+-binding RTX toxin-like protein